MFNENTRDLFFLGQSVFHLHMHILGCKGNAFTWPPGTTGGKKE